MSASRLLPYLLAGAVALVLPFLVHAATNVVSNGAFETPSSSDSSTPAGWVRGRWGTNTTSFSYPATGPDGSKAAQVTISAYTSGDAKWAFTSVPVTAGATYTYSDSYLSDVPSWVTLQYTMSDGTFKYPDVAHPGAASSWTNESYNFTAPSGATKVTVFHLINQVGSLTIDNVSLTQSGSSPPPPPPPPPPPGEFFANPDLESGASNAPDNWNKGHWGTNNATFTYPVAGQSGNAARVAITSYSSGDAKWYPDYASVTSGDSYLFTDYSKATTASYITVQFKHSDGSFSYLDLGSMAAHSSWSQFSKTFTVPAGVSALTVFHLIKSTGQLDVDTYSLTASAPPADPSKFDKGYVSLNFDDGYETTYQNAYPILDTAGFNADVFVVTGYVLGQFPDYMSQSQVLSLQSRGYEIGAHTRTHPDLTTLSTQDATNEIVGSRQDLLDMGVRSVNFFAYPFGAYNDNVVNIVKNAGFTAARSSDGTYNPKDVDRFILRRAPMVNTTTMADVKNYVQSAVANHWWVILLFHRVDNSGDTYSVTPQFLQQVVDYLKSQNITPITLSQGVTKMNQ